MIEFLLSFAVFFSETFTPVPAQEFPILEQEAIQGTWVVTYWSVRGDDGELSKEIEMTVFFSKNHFISRITKNREEEISEFDFALIPSQRPFGFNGVPATGNHQGQIYKGIYRLNQDFLEICMPIAPEDDRPTNFTPGDDWEFIKMKRQH